MTSQRITVQSKDNIAAATHAEIVELKDLIGDRFTVKVWKSERFSFIMGSKSVILYPSANAARRAIKRIRSELEITFFD